MIDLRCGDCLEFMKDIPDHSIDLVIADPPYFKVIPEKWDNMWRTEEDYFNWSFAWITEIARVLRFGGTFYCFGYFRNLIQVISNVSMFGLVIKQQIIIDKGIRAIAGRATKKYKQFPNVTESIVMMVKDNRVMIKPFLKSYQKKLKLKPKEINEALGVKSNGGGMWSIWTGKNICEQFPTREYWEKLQKLFGFDLDYAKVAQTFNPEINITDVWSDIDFYEEKHQHPTQKPLKLIKRLLTVSSNANDIILDPFMGSGTTGVACKELGRNFIGMEKDQKYFEIARARIEGTTISTETEAIEPESLGGLFDLV